MDAQQHEALETIYDRIDDVRRARDAAGRLCARNLIAGDMDGAQWQARSMKAYDEELESLRIQVQEGVPAPE
jgi:hypothetical protein